MLIPAPTLHLQGDLSGSCPHSPHGIYSPPFPQPRGQTCPPVCPQRACDPSPRTVPLPPSGQPAVCQCAWLMSHGAVYPSLSVGLQHPEESALSLPRGEPPHHGPSQRPTTRERQRRPCSEPSPEHRRLASRCSAGGETRTALPTAGTRLRGLLPAPAPAQGTCAGLAAPCAHSSGRSFPQRTGP